MQNLFPQGFLPNNTINQVPFTTPYMYSNIENGGQSSPFGFYTDPKLGSTFNIDPKFIKNPNPQNTSNQTSNTSNNNNSSSTNNNNNNNNNNNSSTTGTGFSNTGSFTTGTAKNTTTSSSSNKTGSVFTQYKNNFTIASDVQKINQLTNLIRQSFEQFTYSDICNGVNPTMNFRKFDSNKYDEARKLSETLPQYLNSSMQIPGLVGIKNFNSKYLIFSNEENTNKDVNLIKKPDLKNKRILLSMLDSLDAVGEKLETGIADDQDTLNMIGNWKLFLSKTKFSRKDGEKLILQIPDIYLSLCTEIIIMFGSVNCLFDDRINASLIKCIMEMKINMVLLGGLLCLFGAEQTYFNFMKFCQGLKDMSAPRDFGIDFKIRLPGDEFSSAVWINKDEFPRKLARVIRNGYLNYLQNNDENNARSTENSQAMEKAYQKVWDSKDINQLSQNTRLVEETKRFISGDEQLGKLVEGCKSAKGFLKAFFSKNIASIRDDKDAYENALVVRKKLIQGYINSKGPLTIANIKKIGAVGNFITTRIERLYSTTFGKMSRENVSWFGLSLTEFMDYFGWTSNLILRAKSLYDNNQLNFVYSADVSNNMIQEFLSGTSNSLPKLIELRCCLPNLYGIFCTNGARKDKMDCFELCKEALHFVEYKKTWAQWSELDSFWLKVTNDAKTGLSITQQNVCRKNLGLPELKKGVNNLQSAIRSKLNGASNFDFFKDSVRNRTSMFSVFTKEEREERAKAMKEKRLKEEENRKKNVNQNNTGKENKQDSEKKSDGNSENTNLKTNDTNQNKTNPVFMKTSYSVNETNERLKNKDTTVELPKLEISSDIKLNLVPEFQESQVSKEASLAIIDFKDKYLKFLEEYGEEKRNLPKLKEAFEQLGDWLEPLTIVSENFRNIANAFEVVVPDNGNFANAADLLTQDTIPKLDIGDSMLSMKNGKLIVS